MIVNVGLGFTPEIDFSYVCVCVCVSSNIEYIEAYV